MRVTIVAVGRLKERFWREASEEYLKRLRRYASVEVAEIEDRDPGRGGASRALAQEAADILRAIPEGAYVFALAIDGREVTSEQLADKIDSLGVEGRSSVAFLIGGSEGLAPELERAADERISLGRITLPHNLARVVLLEQVYRAFKINRGEPYHK